MEKEAMGTKEAAFLIWSIASGLRHPLLDGRTISGHVSPSGHVLGTVSDRKIDIIKRYYYIGDKSKEEKTTIIHFRRGKVVKYERT